VTWSATDPALAANGWKHWFRANGNDNDQGLSDAAYIARVLKPNCAFVLTDDTAYGRSLGQIVVNTLRSDAVRYTAELGAVSTGASARTQDLSPFVRRVARSHCSALFYGGYDAESANLRAQLTQKGLGHVTMVSGDRSFTTTFIRSAGVAGNGTVTTCPCGDVATSGNREAATFVADYTARWGEAPGVYSADAYDVARMFINALLARHTDPASITTYLDTVHYRGLAGNYAFAPNHELLKSDVKIYFWRDVDQTWVNLGWDRLVLPKA
jgi:branched-chain amino acid transport system substrate-binding protein